MVTTIEQAIRPLSLTSYILGLGVHNPDKFYLSILYNVTLWSVYIFLYCYVVITLKGTKWFLATSTLIHNGINLFVKVTSIFLSLYQYKRFQTFIKKLAAVDDTLEELGTPKIYEKLYVCIKRALIGWLVCCLLGNINDMIWWYRTTKNYWCMILPYIVNCVHYSNMFMDIIFAIFLWYIGTRFDKLNECMKCLVLKEKHAVRYRWRNAVRPNRRYTMCNNNYKHVLWTSMHLHLELCHLARELNAMFEIQITAEMAAYLIFLTRMFRYTFINIQKNAVPDNEFSLTYIDWINIQFWIFLYVGRLFCLNYICESVSAKSNDMNTIIHRLTILPQYTDIRNEIYQFTLQMMQHPLKFSGLGLFHFGNGFLRKFVMTILTFIIIVIQMPGTSKSYLGF